MARNTETAYLDSDDLWLIASYLGAMQVTRAIAGYPENEQLNRLQAIFAQATPQDVQVNIETDADDGTDFRDHYRLNNAEPNDD